MCLSVRMYSMERNYNEHKSVLVKVNDFSIYCRVLFLSMEVILRHKLKALQYRMFQSLTYSLIYSFICFILSCLNHHKDLVLPKSYWELSQIR